MTVANAQQERPLQPWKSMIVAVVCAVVLFAQGCGHSKTDANAVSKLPPCEVRTLKIGAQTAQSTVILSGITEPIRRVTPATRLMAKVIQANFSEGDRVKANQVLVRLDVKDLEAKRRQVLSAVDAANTAYEIAENNLKRMQDLADSGSTTQINLEQMQINHAQASTARVTANSALTELDMNLAYATIRAPFNGVIVQRLVEVGNTVGPGQPLLILEDDSRLKVVASIGTDAASQIAPGETITVRIDDETIDGEVEAVVSSGDPRAPGWRINVLIDNSEHRLKSGTLATVEAPLADRQANRVAIPRDALITRGNLTGVFVVDDDNTAHLRWLLVDEAADEMVPVITGLQEGERIVLSSDENCVKDGRRIEEAN